MIVQGQIFPHLSVTTTLVPDTMMAPSLDELEFMHQNISQTSDLWNVGQFQNAHYWPSTGYDNLQAYVFVFNYNY